MSDEPTLLFCVGAAKSGTTWLYRYLHDHPECHLRSIKELHFFDTIDFDDYDQQFGVLDRLRRDLVAKQADLSGWHSKNVQRQIDDIDEIRGVIGESMRAIDGARETISVLASQDMNFAIQSKSRVHEMLQHLKRLNGSVEQALDEVATVNREIDSLTGDAVRSLQFEDIVRQLTAHSERHLDRVSGVVSRVHAGLVEPGHPESRSPGEFVEAVADLRGELDRFVAEEVEKARKPVEQESMTEGDVELF